MANAISPYSEGRQPCRTLQEDRLNGARTCPGLQREWFSGVATADGLTMRVVWETCPGEKK